MITEDYVSFEVAKLLKEKSFDEICATAYETRTSKHSVEAISINDWGELNQIKRPTLQMTMRWLREVHNIMISPYALSLGWCFEIYDLNNRDITGCKPLYKVGIPNKQNVLNNYEKACETAIKYCLENLI